MMMGKALKILLLLSLITFAVVGCGGGGNTPAETEDAAEPVVSDDASEAEEVEESEEMPAEDEAAAEEIVAEDEAASEGMIDLSSAAAQLGVSEEDLMNALGDPSEGTPDMAAAAEALGVSEEELNSALGIEVEEEASYRTVTINGVDFEINYDLFTWADLPADVVYEREPVQSYTDENGVTHWYEVVYVFQR